MTKLSTSFFTGWCFGNARLFQSDAIGRAVAVPIVLMELKLEVVDPGLDIYFLGLYCNPATIAISSAICLWKPSIVSGSSIHCLEVSRNLLKFAQL